VLRACPACQAAASLVGRVEHRDSRAVRASALRARDLASLGLDRWGRVVHLKVRVACDPAVALQVVRVVDRERLRVGLVGLVARAVVDCLAFRARGQADYRALRVLPVACRRCRQLLPVEAGRVEVSDTALSVPGSAAVPAALPGIYFNSSNVLFKIGYARQSL
jgi:hypothetical protein